MIVVNSILQRDRLTKQSYAVSLLLNMIKHIGKDFLLYQDVKSALIDIKKVVRGKANYFYYGIMVVKIVQDECDSMSMMAER